MTTTLSADDVQWVVNDLAELGVKIGDRFFFLYKGDSLEYPSGKHDDGTPMRWRPVGKREFGETCHPVKFWKPDTPLPRRYNEELAFIPGLSFGQPGDCDWSDLPTMASAPPMSRLQWMAKNQVAIEEMTIAGAGGDRPLWYIAERFARRGYRAPAQAASPRRVYGESEVSIEAAIDDAMARQAAGQEPYYT